MSISGVSKLAKMELKDPDALEYFDMIDSATDKLDDFIFKMLDFYRSTKIDNKIAKINFKEIVNQQLVAYNEKFNIEHIRIDIHINQEHSFYSDDSKIRVILNNLFSNSVQFQKGDQGENKISLNIDVSEASAVITLIDNGIGIEEKHHPDVFNLFSRATQKNVGTGLGLYMVKEAVEQMGGKIDLESVFGEGTTFKVTLPSMK